MFAMYLVGIVAGDRRRLDAEEDDLPRADAAVRDGTAQLQAAGPGRRAAPDARARLGVHLPRRHADSGRLDHRLGPRLTIPHRRSRRSTRQLLAQQRRDCTGNAGGRRTASSRDAELAAVENQIAGAAPRKQLPRPHGQCDRAGRPAARLGLADRLRGDRVVPGPRGGRGDARRDLQPGRRSRTKTSDELQARRCRTPPGTAPTARSSTFRSPCRSWSSSPCVPSAPRRWRSCAAKRASWRWPAVHVRLHDRAWRMSARWSPIKSAFV